MATSHDQLAAILKVVVCFTVSCSGRAWTCFAIDFAASWKQKLSWNTYLLKLRTLPRSSCELGLMNNQPYKCYVATLLFYIIMYTGNDAFMWCFMYRLRKYFYYIIFGIFLFMTFGLYKLKICISFKKWYCSKNYIFELLNVLSSR